MIINEFRHDSMRTRNSYYSLFNAEGKDFIRALLQAERSVLKTFELSYGTPELRKLDALARRGKATEEQIAILDNAEKVFAGRTPNGLITDKEAINIVSSYIGNLKLINDDLKSLGEGGLAQAVQAEEVVLGKGLSHWNLHPKLFSEAVYGYLFSKTGKEYLRNELMKMFKLKAFEGEEMTTEKVYEGGEDSLHLDTLLIKFTGSDKDRETIKEKLFSLKTVGHLTRAEYRSILEQMLNRTMDEDLKFNYKQYVSLKELLPQYTNRKTYYIVNLLTQYNAPAIIKVNPLITLDSILAFLRKVDELL